MTTSENIKSKLSDFASSIARAALSHTVASCPASRNARDREARVLASSSTMSRLAFKKFSSTVGPLSGCRQFVQVRRQLDHKCCAFASLAAHADFSPMVGDDGLHNR